MPKNRNDSVPRRALARLICRRLDALGLDRVAAAKLLGDAPTQMSRLYRGHVEEFSTERLVRMLLRLKCSVQIVVGPPDGVRRRKAQVVVTSEGIP